MLGEMLGHRVREGHPITTHVPAVALYLWSGTHGEVEVFSVRREDSVNLQLPGSPDCSQNGVDGWLKVSAGVGATLASERGWCVFLQAQDLECIFRRRWFGYTAHFSFLFSLA